MPPLWLIYKMICYMYLVPNLRSLEERNFLFAKDKCCLFAFNPQGVYSLFIEGFYNLFSSYRV